MSRQKILSNLSCPKKIKTNYHLEMGKRTWCVSWIGLMALSYFWKWEKTIQNDARLLPQLSTKNLNNKKMKRSFYSVCDYLYFYWSFFSSCTTEWPSLKITIASQHWFALEFPLKWLPFQGLTPETRSLFLSPHVQFETSSEPPQFWGVHVNFPWTTRLAPTSYKWSSGAYING